MLNLNSQAQSDVVAARMRFDRKLQIFCLDYELSERPALVLQACPMDALTEVNLADPSIKTALAQGGESTDTSSWSGLMGATSGLRGSVDGIACVSGREPPLWASELHTDGHLIAGAWDFDWPAGGEKRFVITWSYVELFADFGQIASRVATKITEQSADWWVTASLLRADELMYGSKANQRSNRVNPPLRRPCLEFRVRRCIGGEGLQRAAELMGKDFQRAYGEPA